MSNTRRARFAGTGISQQVPGRAVPNGPEEHAARLASFDEPGRHLWVVTAAWRIDPAKVSNAQTMLDTENLLMISPPGCFKCEEQYTPRLAAAPCNGSVL